MEDDEIQSIPDDEPEDDEGTVQEDGDDESYGSGDSDAGEGDFDDVPQKKVGLTDRELKQLTCSEQITRWMQVVLPPEADLISELDASNLFLIHAESVICELVASKEVNFDEDLQFLGMTWAIERILENFRASRGVFRILFFDCFKQSLSPAMWAYRQAFLVHCQVHKVDHVVFAHWYCPEWEDHVQAWRPSFFLLSAAELEVEEEEEEEEEAGEKDAVDGEEEGEGADEEGATGATLKRRSKPESSSATRTKLFQALVLSCLGLKTHVALVRGLRRDGNRMMAFVMDPDNYNRFIDLSIKGTLKAMFEEPEEGGDEEADDSDVAKDFQSFAKKFKDKVKPAAQLRTFLLVRFLKGTTEKFLVPLRKANRATDVQLTMLVLKATVLQEMLMRQVPVDNRALRIPSATDWELYSEKGMAALDRYFEMIAKDLGALYPHLASGGALEASDLDACDLFDGRLYRYVFIATVAEGLGDKKKEVAKKFFELQEWAEVELNFLWDEAGKGGVKEGFFPISISEIKDMEDITPPPMPDNSKETTSRIKPKLLPVTSEILDPVWKESAAPIEEKNEDEEEIRIVPLFDAENEYEWRKEDEKAWQVGVRIDSLRYEEKMELSGGEQRMLEKMKAKAKITEGDQKYLKQYRLKQVQQRIKELAMRAKSLGGADQLHNPIIVQEKKAKEDDKNKKETKISAKQQEIMDKNAAAEEQKIKESDAKQMVEWEKNIDKLGEVLDIEKFQTSLLDMLIGFGPARVVDSFERFPQVAAKFKRRDSQAQVVVKVVNTTRKVLKKMQLDKLSDQEKVCKLVRYFVCLIMEAFSSFGKIFDGKQIKYLQEGLVAVGFHLTAGRLFAQWKEWNKPTEAAPAKDEKGKKGKDEKGKKEDKKKDDKKDDKKDKKDKKSGKDDSAAAAGDEDLDKFMVAKVKDDDLIWGGVGPDEYAWQLMYMGPYMARTVGNAPDPKGRVKFKPDLWQKNLLDIVDNGESALVVAPTASGKTFIGYYTMDKVLREDHDGIAVYIAPSAALVRQVSAEIFARFQSKSYPAHSQQQLFGVFLRDHNMAGGVVEEGKWRNCQVLVTIPHIFEMLLLSVSEVDWVKRLRWVIFDECHSIGNRNEGTQWERIMQLIPCPFIALSATIADEHHFHDWLSAVSKTKEHPKVHLVQHSERWNDLYKHMYVGNELRPLHPFCCLLEQVVKNRGLSADLALTPQESMHLFQEVQKLLGKNAAWDKLRPLDFFQAAKEKVPRRDAGGDVLRDEKDEVIYDEKDVVFLKKNVTIAYSKAMKETFLEHLKAGVLTHEMFDNLIQALQEPAALNGLDKKFAPPPRVVDASVVASKSGGDLTRVYKSMSYLQADSQLRLFKQLEANEILPAIVFNFSRKELEKMLKSVVQRLKDLQHDKYYGDEEKRYHTEHVIMKKRRDDYQKAMTAWEQAQKAKGSKKQESTQARKAAEDGEGGRGERKVDAADVSEDTNAPEPEPPVDVADEIDPEFSFHSQKVYGQAQEDIDHIFHELKFKKVSSELIDALRRGIGLHHEGHKNIYKQAVETLFRKGFLKVVFATATLALGINMPCRSTIFCGDSLELNGLMFRQMSGRAGRRGFDLLGQVIFWDMGFAKVQRLVASEMPSLTGEFRQSPSMMLRMILEEENRYLNEQVPGAKRLDEAIVKARKAGTAAAVKVPFFRSEGALLEKEVATVSRFQVELLRRESLISSNGYTRNLASVVSHLFEADPANLILNRILSKGLLHRYLSEQAVVKADKTTWRTVRLAAVLGWFVHRQRLPERPGKYVPQRKRNLPSKDCPELPKLPDYMLQEIQDYNQMVLDLFQEMAFCVCSTQRKLGDAELVLPFSKRRFPNGFDPRGEPAQGSKFFDAYSQQIIRQKSRSPFSALGGFDDFYRSPADLAAASRQLLHIDISHLPMIPPPPGCDLSAGLEPANSYIVDLLMHGHMKLLPEDNGLNQTLLYPLVRQYTEFLDMASFAMKEMAPKGDLVVGTFEELSKDLKALNKARW